MRVFFLKYFLISVNFQWYYDLSNMIIIKAVARFLLVCLGVGELGALLYLLIRTLMQTYKIENILLLIFKLFKRFCKIFINSRIILKGVACLYSWLFS